MEQLNRRKADAVHRVLASHAHFYRCRAQTADRSLMNVAFSLPHAAVEQRFLAEADAAGFYGLKGHRSVGGVRISLYNPVTEAAVAELTAFMSDFARRHG